MHPPQSRRQEPKREAGGDARPPPPPCAASSFSGGRSGFDRSVTRWCCPSSATASSDGKAFSLPPTEEEHSLLDGRSDTRAGGRALGEAQAAEVSKEEVKWQGIKEEVKWQGIKLAVVAVVLIYLHLKSFDNWSPSPLLSQLAMAGSLISCSPSVDQKIEKPDEMVTTGVLASLQNFLRKCLIAVLSYGPMPKHIAFIMDGNRRYAKFQRIQQGAGHRVGFSALIASLLYCYEMGVKYITVYAFSIDNFKRDPSEVQSLMQLMEEKINELLENRRVINKINCKINFWGKLDLLCEPVRLAAEKLMASTAGNSGLVFSVCMPYNSTSEIVNAVNEVCMERREMLQREHAGDCNGHAATNGVHSEISVADLDLHMYSAGCPDPDIVIRTSGETRLSNFLLWQTTFSHLQNPDPLWPEFSFRHLVWAILQYQRAYPYLEQNRKLAKKQL